VKLSEGKVRRLNALANESGVIAALAMDQRGSLRKALAAARGVDAGEITFEMMAEFKTAVTEILTPYASAVLLDPEYGLGARNARSRNAGLLLAYEKSGYDNKQPGRLPDLLDNVSARRIANWKADAVKVLLYYSPFEEERINDIKHAFIERIGAECEDYELPFFLEFVGYDTSGGDEKSFEYAKIKPDIVRRSIEEFTKPQYKVDVLKVEVPVNTEFVEGSVVFKGRRAYTRDEALEHFRRSAAAATRPFIYLSAGVSNEQFVESLRMAVESGADFSGVLCGRATWKNGIPVYAREGRRGFASWLESEGVRNIEAVNGAIRGARPWWSKLGLEAPARRVA
jgi:tagatose 1,6-diphosphate aldolase